MTGIYRMANLCIRIDSVFAYVHELCAAYRCGGAPDFAVQTGQADIDGEREKSLRAGLPSAPYEDGYLESLAVYRRIAERLPEYGGFVFHGSALAADGQGYLFTAASGTGKSTHARLWRELLGSRAVMINDDKPVIRFMDGKATVCGTPWDGKHRLSGNITAPLKAVCILERAKENAIREITKDEALPMLIQQAYRPADPAALAKTLSLLERLPARLYRLRCNMEIGAAALSYNTMKEEEP